MAVTGAMGPHRALLPLLLLSSSVLAQVTIPLRLPKNASGEGEEVSYVLGIEGRPYTIRLQQHAFLSDDFRIYVSNEKGPLRSDSSLFKGRCHYRGYVEGFPSSAVTLSTCSGLRGFLQFENVSYGIEPLDYSPAFEHFVYRMSDEKPAGSLLATSPPGSEPGGLTAEETANKAQGGDQPLSAKARSPKYFKVYVVMDKALYKYLGSDMGAAMQKIIQVFNLVNNMFNPLNVTIVLSSLELWKEENKISTAEEADVLLQRFLQWKQPHLAQRSYDVAYLLVYRDRAEFVGAAALGKACQRDAAAAVAVYQDAVTLESFSVLLAQLLARSLGVNYDNPQKCHCPRNICIMSPEALGFSGAKAFSSCSVGDFETFLRRGGGACLFHQPRLTGHSYRRAPVCGNGVVEPGEQCDCGVDEECLKDKCCSERCQLKPGAKCSSGLCCKKCQFKRKNSQCRPAADAQCDLAEFCNGSSASCPPDLYVQDGHGCERGTGYCYQGHCQSPDLQCQALYGRGSKNAPMACYEEVNSQQDRFGHCGVRNIGRYKTCARRNLRCGKLICTYPHSTPLASTAAAILYVQVRKHLCVSMDYFNALERLDPLLVPPGTKCGSGKACINGTCHPRSVLGYSCDSDVQCHGHGVCNNKGHCHCQPGWQPPNCLQKGSHMGGSIDSSIEVKDYGLPPRGRKKATLVWTVLGSCLPLLLLAGAVCLVLWRRGWHCGQQTHSTDSSYEEESSDPLEPEPDPGLDPAPDPHREPEMEMRPGPGPCRGR